MIMMMMMMKMDKFLSPLLSQVSELASLNVSKMI